MSRGTPLPTQLGSYTINHNHHIGRGTHGEVCVGVDTSTNVEVAVKRVKRDTSESSEQQSNAQRRIERELDTLRTISHPNVIRLLHYDFHENHGYFFLELCDFDLQSFARERGSEFASLKLRFIQDSSRAVGCLHGNNIIHRDLKPENILVKEIDGTWILKVSDFGLARRIPDGAGSRSFSATAGRGTFAYMAPDLLPPDGHARYSKPADIFSLGLVHLSIIEHTGGQLLPKTVDGQTLAQWVRDEQLRRGVEAVEVPSLSTGEERGVVRAVKGLCQRMVRFLPAERCKIADVLAELHRIRQRSDNGESYPDAPTGSDATSPGHLPPTTLDSAQMASSSQLQTRGTTLPHRTLHSAEMASSSHPSGATFYSPALQSAQSAAPSPQLQSISATLPNPEVQSMDVAEQNTSRIQAQGVSLVLLKRHAMPFKPHKAIINFGLGQELEALWLEAQKPNHLHYSKYRDGVWEEAWTKELPDEQQWNCRKFVSSACILLQSINKTVCFYDPESLEPSGQSRSPGWVVGLTGQGRAVVGNHASPTVAYQGVTLHVCELESLQTPVVTLRLPEDKMYGMEGLICASGASDGHVAVTDGKNYVDLFDQDGHHISRVDLPGQTRRPSCTTRHVFVPVRREPPTIAVISWRGEIERVLGAAELGLRENEWCWSISPTHDGKFNVLMTDTEYQDFIVTYQIEA